jgi:serine/threonine protein kinase
VKLDSERPFTYVIMLSGRDAKDDIVAGLDAGADDYLTKPVEPAILRSRLAAGGRIVEAVPPKEWSMPRVPGYEVKRLIGKGAFATVWEAARESDGLPVALKIIRVDLATEDVFGRFAREVRLMQQMDHPNIARVYDSRVDQKLGYCAMELIDGRTLDKFVLQDQPGVRKLLALIAQIGDALEHAHRQGVLHRDLKPSNIMVGADLSPKLVDFGLGKSMFRPEAEPEPSQTMDGSVVGTPLFMAPEQARGENDKLDGRTDVYALGVVLYVMLLRRHPHKVDNADWRKTVRSIAKGRARPPSEFRRGFDPELERMMMKALADDRAERYQSAAEFAADLRKFVKERWPTGA